MANIKNKYSSPLSTEFTPKDLVVDIKNGHLYYKSNLGVHKLIGDNSSTGTEAGVWQSGVSDTLYYTAGNVGIGTTTPSYDLDVEGDIKGIMLTSSGSSTDEGGHLTLLPPLGGGYIWNVDNYQENFRLFTEGTETVVRMQISSSGYVGMGTTSPDQLLHINNGSSPQILIEKSVTGFVRLGVSETAGVMCLGWDDGDDIRFGLYDSPTDTTLDTKMTIKSNGRVGIGVDPSLMLDVEEDRDGTFIARIKNSDTSNDAHVLILQTGESTVSAGNHFIAFRNGDGTNIGAIKGDGAGGVSFDEGSDIRLKKEISPTKYGIGNLMGIEIVEYKYKDSNKFRTGIIAQQAIDHYPPAVKDYEKYNIEKGLTPEDKEYQYMTVAYQKYIPLLMKSLQDSYTQITELEKRIKKLENG